MNEEITKSKIPVGLMWSLTILVWLLFIIWAINFAGDGEYLFSSILLYSCQLLCIIVFIFDIIKTDIFNKPAWIIMIVVLSLISFPIYLIQRNRLIRIEERKTNFTGKKEE